MHSLEVERREQAASQSLPDIVRALDAAAAGAASDVVYGVLSTLI